MMNESPDPLAPDPLAPDEPEAKPDRRDWRGRVRRRKQVGGGFGVGHLLLWVGCCAAYFAAIRHLAEDDPGLVGMLYVLVLALGTGAGLAGMLLFFGRRLCGARWQVEPGEWLLPAFGARFAVELISRIWLEGYLANQAAVATTVTCCLLLLPLFSNTPARWKALYVYLILLFCVPLAIVGFSPAGEPTLAGEFANRLSTWMPVLAGVPMLPLVIWDFVARIRHGWLHWVGLCTFVSYLVVWWYLVSRQSL